jgi:hypothetical protein
MSFAFDPQRNLIIVSTRVLGPVRNLRLRLALGTGATRTLINQSRLLRMGYDPSASEKQIQITTGSNIEFVTQVFLLKLQALGRERDDFPVLCHNLPPTASVDGLLGLDFFRGLNLNIDFRSGLLTLS